MKDKDLRGSIYRALLRYAVAIPVVLAAAGLRVWPLGALELRIP